MGGVILLTAASSSLACDVPFDPSWTWEKAIDEADVVFVGLVVEASPETDVGWGRATFTVQRWIKGGSGTHFVSVVGSGGNCTRAFSVGEHVIYGGGWMSVDGEVMGVADDTGPQDPTVSIDDPPTPEQLARLDYLYSTVAVR